MAFDRQAFGIQGDKMKRMGMGLVGLALCGGGAQAAGFALYEHSASALGNAFAGQAVVARDASTIFANPAGLTEVVGGQAVAGGQLISSSVRFDDGNPATANGGDGGDLTLVPSVYYAMDLTPKVKLGVGVFAPFGLKTEYDSGWVGSTVATLSDMKTVNLNPSLAWKVNPRLSLGFGIDYQYVEATLAKEPVPGVVRTTMKGDDASWGYNLGLLYRLDDATQLAMSYRSAVAHRLEGEVSGNAPGLPLAIFADATLPDMASLAVQRRLDRRWSLVADATWTGWSHFDQLDIRMAANGAPLPGGLDIYDWEDAWRVGIGAEYRYNDAWTWRFGLAYDQTPIADAAHRKPRIPDSDRVSIAFGGRYAFSRQTQVDFGYMHIFFSDSSIAAPSAPVGDFKGYADILGAQLNYSY